MRSNIIYILIFFMFINCVTSETNELSEMKMLTKDYDFGEIKLSDSLNTTFKIVNISEIPLQLSKVGTQCDCTTTDYTQTPVKENDTAKIFVSFKPSNVGYVDKSVVVETNTIPPYAVFKLKGNVVE